MSFVFLGVFYELLLNRVSTHMQKERVAPKTYLRNFLKTGSLKCNICVSFMKADDLLEIMIFVLLSLQCLIVQDVWDIFGFFQCVNYCFQSHRTQPDCQSRRLPSLICVERRLIIE